MSMSSEKIYGITIYRPDQLMPTKDLPQVEREASASSGGELVVENAGFFAGHFLTRHLAFQNGLVGQLIKTEQGKKFELYLHPTGPGDSRFSRGQLGDLMKMMSQRSFGIRFVYRNGNGLMLVITPLPAVHQLQRTDIQFGLERGQLTLTRPQPAKTA
jgi:hypothetical protein